MANEKRLIEYVVKEEVCKLCDNKKEYCGKEKCPVYKAPAVDAVEIPDCKKCAFNNGIAYWHQCEGCFGNAKNNFVPLEEVTEDGK